MAVAPRRRQTLLAVDDEASIRRWLTTGLDQYGYDVIEAADLHEALWRLSDIHVDAVILDVRLPQGSGLDVLASIRQHPKLMHLPVLILTGVSLTDEEEDRIRRHRAYVFYKPGGIEAITEKLDQLLRQIR